MASRRLLSENGMSSSHVETRPPGSATTTVACGCPTVSRMAFAAAYTASSVGSEPSAGCSGSSERKSSTSYPRNEPRSTAALTQRRPRSRPMT